MPLINLLINADDFGISQAVNEAIVYCFQRKIIQRTTLMVNMPYTEEAVEVAYGMGFADRVGLHLNLIEGTPLTDDIRHTVFCNSSGDFNGTVFVNVKNRFLFGLKTREALSMEIEAQIVKYKQYGFSLMHIDSHQHTHTNPSVLCELYPLLNKYKFSTVRLSRNIPQSDIRGIKWLYKKAFNHIVLSFNERTQDATLMRVTKFGSQDDVSKEFAKNMKTKGSIEMEIHPSMLDGSLIELYNSLNIEEWLKQHNNQY